MSVTVLRSAMFAGVSLLAATASLAQTAPAAPAAAPAATQDADANIQDIVVTGTRIKSDGYTAPTPVTVASTEELAHSTPSSIPDGLNKLPQFANSSSPSRSNLNFANQPTHGNILNLRGVGPLRTLVLFDGIRVPATTYLGTVDTNVLPQLLIQRVDVVTGGASAAYGSDAVSGVVNFVLNKNFTGVTGVVQGGISGHNDNGNQRIGLAGGTGFAGGRGHVLLSGEYYNNDGMLRNARKIGRIGYTYVGANANCVNPTPATTPTACQAGGSLNPFVATADVRITTASAFGRITGSSVAGNPFTGQVFNADGTTRAFNAGTPTGSAFPIGGDGYTIPSNTSAIAPLKTYQTFSRVSYDVTDDVSVYAQGMFSRSDLHYTSLNNGFVAPTGANIYKNNPFLSPAIAATLPTNNDFISIGLYNVNGPHPVTQERTDYYSGTAGIEGKITDRIRGDLSYTYGNSLLKTAQSGLYDFRKAYAALDVVTDPSTGKPTCAVLLNPTYAAAYAGCQPLDIMHGEPSTTTPAGYAYATGTSRYQARIVQNSVIGSLQADVVDLPAGALSVVVGAEYRDQKLDLTSNADPSLLDTAAKRAAYFAGPRGVSSSATIYYLTNVGTAHGSLNVKEGFAEVAIPVLKDVPFAEALDLNAAGRITDYSTSGTVKTWKLGGTWKPVRDLLLRTTWSRDIRAPNLFELYSGDQFGIGTLIDPVSGQTNNFTSVTGGNPNLKPEVGKTLTFGGVVTPSFLPGFSFAADYYKLKITNQIASLGVQQIVTNCYNLGASAPECALITRATPTSFPSLVRIAPANISFVDTRGIDFDASYRTTLGEGALALRGYLNYLERYRSQQYKGAPILEYAGVNAVLNGPTAYPRWRGTGNIDYVIGQFGVTWSEQFIGAMKVANPGGLSNFVNPHVSPVWYTDLSLRYDAPNLNGKLQFFFTINNLFDKNPPLLPTTVPANNMPTNIAVYDQIGRAFTGGVKFTF